MALQRPILTDFTAGELSPKFAGRAELELYTKGCATLDNWVPFTQGGVITRPATRYMGITRGGAFGRLIPFVVNEDNAFVLEFTNLRIRIWRLGVLVGAPTEVVTTYTEAQIPFIQYAKDRNELYLVHPNHPVRVLEWTGGVNFSLSDLTITCATGVGAWVAATDYTLGQVVRNGAAPLRVYECIVAGTSAGAGPTTEDYDIADGTVHWCWLYTQPFSAANDYPATIAHFGGRMYYGGTLNRPQTVWASQPFFYGAFDYFNMTEYSIRNIRDAALWADPLVPETEDILVSQAVYGEGGAFDFECNSDEEETIMWLVGADALIIGTATSEWVVHPSVSALDIRPKMRSRLGSARVQATMMADGPVMVQGTRSKSALREYAYLAESSELQSPDLTFAADHMLVDGCTQMAFMRVPQPTIFCVTSGEIAAMLYNKPYGVSAWYHMTLDGGTVESICVVPSGEDNQVYAIVNRASGRCVERFADLWDMSAAAQPLDSWVDVIIAAATQAGLERFNGETVTIFNFTTGLIYTAPVAGGQLTYPAGCDINHSVRIGMRVVCRGQTMKLNTSTPTGPGQTALKRVMAVAARCLNSMPFQAGYSDTVNLETAQLPDSAAWTVPYTGDVHIPFQGDWDRGGWVWFVQNQPYRSCILALVPEVDS